MPETLNEHSFTLFPERNLEVLVILCCLLFLRSGFPAPPPGQSYTGCVPNDCIHLILGWSLASPRSHPSPTFIFCIIYNHTIFLLKPKSPLKSHSLFLCLSSIRHLPRTSFRGLLREFPTTPASPAMASMLQAFLPSRLILPRTLH